MDATNVQPIERCSPEERAELETAASRQPRRQSVPLSYRESQVSKAIVAALGLGRV